MSAFLCHFRSRRLNEAHRRKLLGNPPTSAKKQTIGDEANWEVLLECCREDLILWTRDGTYAENEDYLAAEYKHRTGKYLLLITERFSDAIKRMGASPSQDLIDQEQKLADEVKEARTPHSLEFRQWLNAAVTSAGMTPGDWINFAASQEELNAKREHDRLLGDSAQGTP